MESSLRTFTFENGDIAVQMGTPTDCVYLGVNALMRPRPDIVVSMTDNGWFAARPSGTEDAYKIYCESFLGEEHRKQIEKEAVEIVSEVLKNA